jgi:hypothetical protein
MDKLGFFMKIPTLAMFKVPPSSSKSFVSDCMAAASIWKEHEKLWHQISMFGAHEQ